MQKILNTEFSFKITEDVSDAEETPCALLRSEFLEPLSVRVSRIVINNSSSWIPGQ